MKLCLYCDEPLVDTAIRCGHCRRPVTPPVEGDRLFGAWPRIRGLRNGFDHRWREAVRPAWGGFEVLVVTLGAIALAWVIAQERTGVGFVDWCRRQWELFRQEPLLQSYLYVFTQTLVLKLLVVAAILVSVWSRGSARPWEALGFRPALRPLPWWVVPAYFVFSLIVTYRGDLDPLVPHLPTSLFFEGPAAVGNLLAVVSWVVVAPLTEEAFFRGYVYPALSRQWGALASLAATSALFALAHAPQLGWDPGLLAWMAAGSLFLTAARMLTGSTWPAAWMHATYNAMLVVWGLLKYGALGY